MRAPLLALLGLLVAATPALPAARNADRGHAGQQRAKVSAPASSSAGKPARATTGSSRTQAAAPSRGTRTYATASTRGSRAPVRYSQGAGHGRAYAATYRGRTTYGAATTRRGATYAVATSTACRGGTRHCRIYRVSAPQPMRWSQGLSPALNVQTSNCPAGTMATLATGHSNIVRCMPI